MSYTGMLSRIPGFLKTIFKLGISIAIIALILRKIDEKLFVELILKANPFWILWALIWYACSKIISAFRFNTLLKARDIHIHPLYNLKLYWLCMYYNLLLPGGISGDAYKIKVLRDVSHKSLKSLLTLTLLDRITGVISILQIGFLLLPLVLYEYAGYSLLVIPLSIVGSYILYKKLDLNLSKVWKKASLQSTVVQMAQCIAALGVLYSISDTIHWVEYLELFLISSLATMVPITLGGAGAREISFLLGSQVFGINPELAVAMGFLFYLVATSVSLTGIAFSFQNTVISNLKEE